MSPRRAPPPRPTVCSPGALAWLVAACFVGLPGWAAPRLAQAQTSAPAGQAVSADTLIERGGMLYRATTVKVQEPVSAIRFEERQETVYRPEFTTEMRDVPRAVYRPVAVWQLERRPFRLTDLFNPPAATHQWTPKVMWDVRGELLRVPVATEQYVPETRTVKAPVRELRFVEREETRYVAVGPAPPTLAPLEQTPSMIARAPVLATPRYSAPTPTFSGPLGGVTRYDDGLPRQAIRVPGDNLPLRR